MPSRIHKFVLPVGVAFVICGFLAASVEAQIGGKKKKQAGLGNEIEGAVWQFTATRTVKGKEEKRTGKFRISQKALYEVPMKRLLAERETRIGDVIQEPDGLQLVFNNFDQLDGRAHVKKEKEQKNDLWVGYFTDENKDRWRFELRKIED